MSSRSKKNQQTETIQINRFAMIHRTIEAKYSKQQTIPL